MISPLPRITWQYRQLGDDLWMVLDEKTIVINSALSEKQQRQARRAALSHLRGRRPLRLIPVPLLLGAEALRRGVAAHPVGAALVSAVVAALTSGLVVGGLPSGDPDLPIIAAPAPSATASPTPRPPEPTPSETVEPEPVVEPVRVDFHTAADTSPSPEELDPKPAPAEPAPEPPDPAPEPEPDDPGPEPEHVDECTGLLDVEADLDPIAEAEVCLLG